MENEFQILNSIERNGNITQRDIAKNTGMSLGNVNVLIKRLVKKGFLKIEKFNPKTIRYILTPDGLKLKAELTYSYVKISYKYINEINNKIEILLKNETYKGVEKYLLLGAHDEVCQILINNLSKNKIEYMCIKSLEEFGKWRLLRNKEKNDITQKTNHNETFIVWQPEFISELVFWGFNYINILDAI